MQLENKLRIIITGEVTVVDIALNHIPFLILLKTLASNLTSEPLLWLWTITLKQ